MTRGRESMLCNAKTCNAKLLKVGLKFNLNVMKLDHCISTQIELKISNAQCAHHE